MDRDCERCIYHTEKGCSKWECEGTVTIEDAEKAIRSLQAWEEVLQELEDERAFEDSLGNDEARVELDMCIRIINQHLAEIEEVR